MRRFGILATAAAAAAAASVASPARANLVNVYLWDAGGSDASAIPNATSCASGSAGAVAIQSSGGLACAIELAAGTTLTGLSVSVNQEKNFGVLGGIDIHFEYTSGGNFPSPGSVVTTNYNIFENPHNAGDSSVSPSDTLGIVLTGHSPGAGDTNNVSVDMHFRSDSLDSIAPPLLAGGLSVTEIGGYQSVQSGLSDFGVVFASDVPEPATLGLFGIGMAALRLVRRRKAA